MTLIFLSLLLHCSAHTQTSDSHSLPEFVLHRCIIPQCLVLQQRCVIFHVLYTNARGIKAPEDTELDPSAEE